MSQINPLFVHFRWFFKLTIYSLIFRVPDWIRMSEINPIFMHFRWLCKLTLYFLFFRMEFPSEVKPAKLPVPKEHHKLIWLLKMSIRNTQDELEELDFHCKLYKKSERKEKEKVGGETSNYRS